MMFSLGARASAVRETIAELCESPPSAVELVETVAARVRTVIPYDAGNWMISDPATLLPTSIFSVDSPPALQRALTEFELGDADDLNRFEVLARAPQPAASLSSVTGGWSWLASAVHRREARYSAPSFLDVAQGARRAATHRIAHSALFVGEDMST